MDQPAGRSGAAPMFLALGCVGFISSPALAEDTQTDVQQRGGSDIIVTGTPGGSIRRRPSP